MRDFDSIFSGFQHVTKRISEETNETASIVLPIFQTLKYWLTPNAKAPAESLPQIKTREGNELRSALLKSLDFYMNKYGFFENDMLKAITFLDPRYLITLFFYFLFFILFLYTQIFFCSYI